MPKTNLTEDEREALKLEREERRRTCIASGAASSFSPDEFCTRNFISRPTLYNEINSGRLRSFKVGRQRRISAEAEADWIRSREEESTA